jgi:hypothetical protein
VRAKRLDAKKEKIAHFFGIRYHPVVLSDLY